MQMFVNARVFTNLGKRSILRVRKYGPSQLGKNVHTFYVSKLSSAVYAKCYTVLDYCVAYNKCTSLSFVL